MVAPRWWHYFECEHCCGGGWVGGMHAPDGVCLAWYTYGRSIVSSRQTAGVYFFYSKHLQCTAHQVMLCLVVNESSCLPDWINAFWNGSHCSQSCVNNMTCFVSSDWTCFDTVVLYCGDKGNARTLLLSVDPCQGMTLWRQVAHCVHPRPCLSPCRCLL